MSDWIDKLKLREGEDQERRQREEQLKLRTSRMIDAKLPDFWRICTDFTEAQAKRLQENFPNRPAYVTTFERDGEGFRLRQINGDQRRIDATLDKKGQRVKVEISDSQVPINYRELTAQVNEADELYLRIRTDEKMLMRPEEVAEWFVRKVCGIKS